MSDPKPSRVPLSNVDMIASTGQLLVKTDYVFERGDIIDVGGQIKATVLDHNATWEYPNHNWLLTIECDQFDQLKELLTYRTE